MQKFYANFTVVSDAISEVTYDEVSNSVQIHFRNNGSVAYAPYISITVDMWKELSQKVVDIVPPNQLVS